MTAEVYALDRVLFWILRPLIARTAVELGASESQCFQRFPDGSMGFEAVEPSKLKIRCKEFAA